MSGELRAAYNEAMKFWDEQQAAGTPFTDRVHALEGLLREVWPFTREWKYLCKPCFDTGLVIASCPGDATCGRPRQHGPHDFGTPCWCSLGARFKSPAPAGPDDVEAAGRVKKPARQFSRVGR